MKERTLGRAAPADLSEGGGVRGIDFAVDRIVCRRRRRLAGVEACEK